MGSDLARGCMGVEVRRKGILESGGGRGVDVYGVRTKARAEKGRVDPSRGRGVRAPVPGVRKALVVEAGAS